jgi:hypothetical protein
LGAAVEGRDSDLQRQNADPFGSWIETGVTLVDMSALVSRHTATALSNLTGITDMAAMF